MAACLVCGGCMRKVDASSLRKFKSSIAALSRSMSPTEAEEFRMHCMTVLVDSASRGKDARRALDGMPPRKVAAAAHDIIVRRKAELLERRLKEFDTDFAHSHPTDVSSLVSAISAENRLRREQRKLVVRDVRFKCDHGGTLAFSVRNTGGGEISSVTLKSVLTGIGRSAPWDEHEFTLEFRGGLSIGEEKHFEIRRPAWNGLRNRCDYIADLKLVSLTRDGREVRLDPDEVEERAGNEYRSESHELGLEKLLLEGRSFFLNIGRDPYVTEKLMPDDFLASHDGRIPRDISDYIHILNTSAR